MNLKDDPSQIKLSIKLALVGIIHAAHTRPYEVVRFKQWLSELSGSFIQWGNRSNHDSVEVCVSNSCVLF